jgi:hypothetical protein
MSALLVSKRKKSAVQRIDQVGKFGSKVTRRLFGRKVSECAHMYDMDTVTFGRLVGLGVLIG